jgi:hypothetical protein
VTLSQTYFLHIVQNVLKCYKPIPEKVCYQVKSIKVYGLSCSCDRDSGGVTSSPSGLKAKSKAKDNVGAEGEDDDEVDDDDDDDDEMASEDEHDDEDEVSFLAYLLFQKHKSANRINSKKSTPLPSSRAELEVFELITIPRKPSQRLD